MKFKCLFSDSPPVCFSERSEKLHHAKILMHLHSNFIRTHLTLKAARLHLLVGGTPADQSSTQPQRQVNCRDPQEMGR